MLSGDDGELGRFFMHTPLESVEHGRPATKADAEPRANRPRRCSAGHGKMISNPQFKASPVDSSSLEGQSYEAEL
jgi:hypothetical protein